MDEDGGGSSWPTIKDIEAEATRLRERIRTSDIEKLSELILMDRRSNTIVSHRDVGIGVSQVLPVLVGAFAAHKQIVTIEQPEIHLHPAIQADLGDVFIQSALGDQKNKFIIETHSEHLLLRIMRRMRETYEKRKQDDLPDVHPEDVAVLFVEPVKDKSFSIVREIPLNERGELVKAWPGGFFEEGLREVFS
jgi:predicted ATPase